MSAVKLVGFTREELYEKVWSQRLLVLAKEIGVSDVAIGKACRKARIPMPGRGHWLSPKRQALRRPPLPPGPDGLDGRIEFTVWQHPEQMRPKPSTVEVPPIPIPQRLNKPHPLVKATLDSLRESTYIRNGAQGIRYSQALHVRVTRGLIQRAGVVLQMIVTALEKNGCPVRVDKERAVTVFAMDGEEVKFRLDERTRQVRVPSKHWPDRTEVELVSTGVLALTIDRPWPHRDIIWKDKKDAPIEAQVHEIIATLPVLRAERRAARLQREQEAREAEEAEKRRRERERTERIARCERIRLVEHMTQWERAERIRAFVARVEEAGENTAAPVEVADWARWARELADHLDPLVARPKEITAALLEPDYRRSPNSSKDWWDRTRVTD